MDSNKEDTTIGAQEDRDEINSQSSKQTTIQEQVQTETITNAVSTNATIPPDIIINNNSKDESISPEDQDHQSILQLEKDIQKLVDILEGHERELDITQKRYHAEQQHKLSTISTGGKFISTGIVDYKMKEADLKKLIIETQELIDKVSTCTGDSSTNPELFIAPGTAFMKHTDVTPTAIEVADAERTRKEIKSIKTRGKRERNKGEKAMGGRQRSGKPSED